MTSNPYARLVRLVPGEPVDQGQVAAVTTDGVTVQLRTGVYVRVRGTAQIGDHVYIRGDAIQGPAPALTGTDIEV